MKMSDIGFLKTEPSQTDLKIQKWKTQFPQFSFQKNDFGRFFTFSYSQFIFQHDKINSQRLKIFIFTPHLYTSSSPSLRLTISWTNSVQKYTISSTITQRRE